LTPTHGPAEFRRRFGVSRETLGRLNIYAELLEKWNPTINLVSKATFGDIWSRHFHDSAQVFLLRPPGVTTWVDLGSGAGFPGLVVAILAAEQAPDLQVTLVESDGRKAAFLRSVLTATGIEAQVIARRAEDIGHLSADVVTARALAPLDRLLSYVDRHLASGGCALLPKGENYRQEIEKAVETWRFSVDIVSSETDSRAVILKIGGLARV